MKYALFAPNGVPIVGTREMIPAISPIENPKPNSQTGFVFDWVGETIIDWDNQFTVTRQAKPLGGNFTPKMERVFVCERGKEWLQSQVQCKPLTQSAPTPLRKANTSANKV